MDYTRLDREYDQYWKQNDINKAIANLKEIDFYLSQGHYDTWLNSYENLFKPPYLAGLYNKERGTSFQTIQNNISYLQLLQNFRDYVAKLISESQMIDEDRKRRLAELNDDWFSAIVRAVQGFTEAAGNSLTVLPYLLLAGIAGFIAIKLFKD